MTSVDDLVAWLRAQIDEDEQVAQGLLGATKIVGASPNFYGAGGPAADTYWAHFDPARVLREVEADRAIIAAYEHIDGLLADAENPSHVRNELLSVRRAYRVAIQHRAAARCDRPGYRDEWRP